MLCDGWTPPSRARIRGGGNPHALLVVDMPARAGTQPVARRASRRGCGLGGRTTLPPRHRHPPARARPPPLPRTACFPGTLHQKNPARPTRSFTRPLSLSPVSALLRRALLLKPQGQSGHFTGARAGTVYGAVPAHSQPTSPPPPVIP
jgi:hypothetical protein